MYESLAEAVIWRSVQCYDEFAQWSMVVLGIHGIALVRSPHK